MAPWHPAHLAPEFYKNKTRMKCRGSKLERWVDKMREILVMIGWLWPFVFYVSIPNNQIVTLRYIYNMINIATKLPSS